MGPCRTRRTACRTIQEPPVLTDPLQQSFEDFIARSCASPRHLASRAGGWPVDALPRVGGPTRRAHPAAAARLSRACALVGLHRALAGHPVPRDRTGLRRHGRQRPAAGLQLPAVPRRDHRRWSMRWASAAASPSATASADARCCTPARRGRSCSRAPSWWIRASARPKIPCAASTRSGGPRSCYPQMQDVLRRFVLKPIEPAPVAAMRHLAQMSIRQEAGRLDLEVRRERHAGVPAARRRRPFRG